LERKLQQRSEFFARIHDRKQISWKDVQKRLQPGEAAIEMIRIEKNDSDEKSDSVYYAALIITDQTKNHPEMIVLSNGQVMEKVGAYYRNCILSKTPDTLSYQYYWKKIGEFLQEKNVKTIIFSSDGVYNQISLNSLYNTKSKSYLINEFNIHLVTNTKDIVPLYQKEEAYNNYAILMGYPNYRLGSSERKSIAAANGNYLRSTYALDMDFSGSIAPLEGTKVEVEEIGELLSAKGWQPEIFMGDKALEENIKMSFKPQILHLATHGFFQNSKETRKRTNPLLSSGLLLAGAEMTLQKKTDQQSEDGVLTAYEAMNLNLENTQLVVLSACETGKGEIKNGEGVYGLQRAFMVAGARSIIMSLWKVDDAASQQLMTSFYTLWLNGASKREAFKQAQLQLRTHFPEPFYWTAFVLIGE
jgi:CHAT domain-containing protein